MKKKSLFKCPVCSKALLQGGKQYFCSNGHSFDIARKGYINLLLPTHKGAGDPGDSKEMMECRREFLHKGFYEAFSEQLNEAVVDGLSSVDVSKGINILDAGCGEGYYTQRLKNRLASVKQIENVDMYGIDVSKAAIHYAAGVDKSIRFAIASTFYLPILANSIDFIMCVFAPRDEEEFKRVLKPDGRVIVAAPGARHLLGLREALYGDSEPIGQKGTLGEDFQLVKHINVYYDIHLDTNKDILNLLMMTPYSRHTDEGMVEGLKGLEELRTEVDFNINVYQRK